MDPQQDHWLVRPATIRLLWRASIVGLAALVGVDVFTEHEGHFGMDGWPGFAAWFGFLSCVVLVVGSKGLGKLLKRREDYYGE